jgi:hypothetical protein
VICIDLFKTTRIASAKVTFPATGRAPAASTGPLRRATPLILLAAAIAALCLALWSVIRFLNG